jgi:NADPH2:quinone reductase
MRAVVVDRFMAPSELRVSEIPEPGPSETEVSIDVRAAGCNFFDTLIVQGKYQEKPPFPFSPGGEIAGVVREVGSAVAGVAPGERVMAYLGHGGFAQRVVASADVLVPIPDGMSFEEAAGFPIVYGTAYAAVVQRGQARPGETVVVTAASGGVGLAAIQIAKAVGARVVALASGDKLEVAVRSGADVAIDYRQDAWTDALGAATNGRGADVIVENVGGDVFDGCSKHVAWGGRIVVVGFSSGKIPEVRLNRVLLKHISLVGVHWGPSRHHEPETVREAFRALARLYREKKIAPVVWKTFPLEHVTEALALLGGRQSVGKIVLTM